MSAFDKTISCWAHTQPHSISATTQEKVGCMGAMVRSWQYAEGVQPSEKDWVWMSGFMTTEEEVVDVATAKVSFEERTMLPV